MVFYSGFLGYRELDIGSYLFSGIYLLFMVIRFFWWMVKSCFLCVCFILLERLCRKWFSFGRGYIGSGCC